MFLFAFLVVLVLLYIYWCIKTKRGVRESFSELKVPKQVNKYGDVARKQLTNYTTSNGDVDIRYLRTNLDSWSASNSNLESSNATLNSNIDWYIGQLEIVGSDISAISDSNSNLESENKKATKV